MASSQIPEKMLKNPYVHRGPIKDPGCFYGRAEETQGLLLHTARGQSVSIVGPRRIGKTSLLLHLRHSAQAVKPGTGPRHLFVFLDCQRKPVAGQADIYQWMWDEISKEAQWGKARSAAVQSGEEFEKAVGEFCDASFELTLLIDEFELMAENPQLSADFFTRLRGLAVAYPVSYVTTSGKPLLDLKYEDSSVLSSPFFNIFHPRWLGFLTPEEATELIVRPVQDTDFPGFTQEDIEFVIDLAGYHPAFLQAVCYYLFEYKVTGQRWNKRAESKFLQRFREDANDDFRYAWTQLGRDEQEAMKLICTDQADEVSDPLWDSLAHQCLVYDRKPFSSAFREFVLQRETIAEAMQGPETSPRESIAPSRVRAYSSVLDLFIGVLVLLTIATLILSVLFRTPAGLYISAAFLVIVVILSVVRGITA